MSDYGMSSWIGPAISAVGNIGGGLASGLSQQSSDGFSKKGAGQQLMHNLAATPLMMDATLAAMRQYGPQHGFHPLALLGQGGYSSQAYAGGVSGSGNFGTDYGVGRALDGMGQDISRAMMARETPEERIQREQQLKLNAQQIRQSEIQTAMMEKQLADMNKTPTRPMRVNDLGEVTPNTGNQAIQVTPAQITPIDPRTGKEVGVSAALKNYRYDKDTLITGKTQNFSEATEEDMIVNLQYGLMRAADYFKGWKNPPVYPSENPGPGNYWQYSKLKGVWERKPIILRSRKNATKTRYYRSNRAKRKYYNKIRSW